MKAARVRAYQFQQAFFTEEAGAVGVSIGELDRLTAPDFYKVIGDDEYIS